MNAQFIHDATTSFLLWFDNYLLNRGQAYTNKTGILYNYSDERLPSAFKVFGSHYKQWVGDSSVAGATINSGVYVNGSFSGRSSNSRILDFDNGRVLLSGVSTGDFVTGSFAVKDFNIYQTNQDEEDLILEKKYKTNSQIGHSGNYTYIPPYDQKVPAIYISSQTQENEPFAFGGMDQTNIRMNAVVLCENAFQLDCVLGLFADTNTKAFAHLPFTGAPYTEYGDLKGGVYNYQTLSSSYEDENKIFIESVKSSKMADKLRKNIANNLYVGFLDFDLSQMRNRG